MITDINSEDRLVQQTFAEHLEKVLGWESVYAYNNETFGPAGTLGRANEREMVLVRDLRAALAKLNPDIPEAAREQAIQKLAHVDYSRSLIQHNREFYGFIRNGVPVEWRDAKGALHHALAKVIDFRDQGNNRFLAVRELKVQCVRVPHYNRRADLVCFVNGLPLVFIELKAVYRNVRAGFDDNLTDYLHEHSITHAFHHIAFLVVSNGDQARYGSITSRWEHFIEWKRNDENDKARLDAQALLDGMQAKERMHDAVDDLPLAIRALPDLGRRGVFWHTQGSGKSYSMAFFAEKVRRVVPGNFTFVIITDREDLDDQIWRTFIGCGVTDDKTPRASSGHDLKDILEKNPRFVFTLIHKFNQSVKKPNSERDDII